MNRKPTNRIRELRKENNMSIAQLAKKLDLSPSMVQQIETYKKTLNPDVLIKLSTLFNVSTDYILCQTNIKTKYCDMEAVKDDNC